MNPKRISRMLGILIMVLGFAMSTSVIFGVVYSDMQATAAYNIAVALTEAFGFIFFLYGSSRSRDLPAAVSREGQRGRPFVGAIVVVLGVAMSYSLVAGVMYESNAVIASALFVMVVTIGIGVLFIIRPSESDTLSRREAVVVVGIGWLSLGLFGGLPYMLDGTFVHFEDAYFETLSGFSTTGSTVLTEVDPETGKWAALSMAGQYWRCLTHWLGGMGIIVLFVAIFPQLGVGGRFLFKSEVPGPITEGLKPKIKETSMWLWLIYASLTLVDFLLLWLVGDMPRFEALCHSMATLATGGFSTEGGSLGQYDSASIDIITTGFMFLAGVNFTLYYVAVVQRGTKRALQDRELWTYTTIVVLASLVIAVSLWWNASPADSDITGKPVDYEDFGTALRYASFQVLAVVTTTGFGTANFDEWSPFVKLLLVFLMFMGGSAGSTAGGMKVLRIMVIFKAIYIEIYRFFRPESVRALRIGHAVIHQQVVRTILVFFVLFLFVFVVSTLFVAAFGHDIVTSSTAVVACLANIGPGLAQVNGANNFAFFEPPIKVLLSFLMVLGRLELFTLLVFFLPSFWRR